MAQTTQTAKPALPRGFKILLGVSLAVNLAVAGLVAGAFVRAGPGGTMASGGQLITHAPIFRPCPTINGVKCSKLCALPNAMGTALLRRAYYEERGDDFAG